MAAALIDSLFHGRSILTITQQLQARAAKLRHKPCPAGHCESCFTGYCRTLLIGHCVCTGHIDLTRKDFFPRP